MNILSEIGKDARQFMRERRTLLLLVAAPLIVLFIMAAIFSGNTTAQVKTVTIGVCDLDGSNASTLFVSGIRNNTQTVLYTPDGNCSEVLYQNVRSGRIAAGLVIPAGFEQGIIQGETQNVSLLLDNSRFQVSASIEAFVHAAVQETDARFGDQFIRSVWGRLNAADDRLEQTLATLNETRAQAQENRDRLGSTKRSLEALNISGVRSEIVAANQTVQLAVANLDSAQDNLTQIESRFAAYDLALNQTENDLQSINESLANASLLIDSSYANLNCSDIVFLAYCASLDTLNNSFGSVQQAIESRLVRVQEARAGLAEANATIQEFKASISSAHSQTGEANVRIGRMLDFVTVLELNRVAALQTISDVDSALEEMTNRTYEIETVVHESQREIRATTARKPETVISPMIVSSAYLFGNQSFFQFMLPSLLPLILMFITMFLASTALVREEGNGTLLRVNVAQVNPFEYAFVKVVSYTIVLLPEAILLALVASAIFGAFPLFDLGVWVMVLETLAMLILVFVALGILIAIHSESEATAFLASLVVGLPLLFLSGLLFPFEFMPEIVSWFGLASPLTQAILKMQTILVYHSRPEIGTLILAGYAIIFTLLIGLTLKKK